MFSSTNHQYIIDVKTEFSSQILLNCGANHFVMSLLKQNALFNNSFKEEDTVVLKGGRVVLVQAPSRSDGYK